MKPSTRRALACASVATLLAGCSGKGEPAPKVVSPTEPVGIDIRTPKAAREGVDPEPRPSGTMGDRRDAEPQDRRREEEARAERARQETREREEAERKARTQAEPVTEEQKNARRLAELRKANDDVRARARAVARQKNRAAASVPLPDVQTSRSRDFDPAKLSKVAVMVEDDLYGGSRVIEDAFMQALLSKGYAVASRTDVQAVLKEGDFQRHSGLADKDAAQLGKGLNVPAVILVAGTFTRDGRRTGLSARMVGVEGIDVLWLSTASLDAPVGEDAGGSLIKEMAEKVAAELPERKGP